MPIVLQPTIVGSGKTFLQLCQRTRQECGISGQGPTSVLSQSGEMKRIVDWVNQSWVEIQNMYENWFWMRDEFQFNTVANVQSYTPATAGINQFSAWRSDTLRAYRASEGINDEQYIVEWDYDVFRNTYQIAQQTPGRPVVYAIRPWDKALMFGSIPDGTYVIKGEYQMAATEMAQNNDVPALPGQFHMLIVYEAMKKYAAYENAPEVMSRAVKSSSDMLDRLLRNQAEEFRLGAPLA
jgi:hypothetical protein